VSLLLAKVFTANVVRGEKAQEGRATRSIFYGRSAVGFFPFDDADYGRDRHICFARSFKRVDRGGAGGADVVDNDNAGSWAAKTFDTATGAVRFLGFANEEAVQQRRGGVGLGAPGAGGGDIGDDGVGAESEAADGFGIDAILLQKLKHSEAGEPTALGVEGGGPAVDVVVARCARGELELAEAKAGSGEKGEKLLGVGGHL
jgi:hypothetical protein